MYVSMQEEDRPTFAERPASDVQRGGKSGEDLAYTAILGYIYAACSPTTGGAAAAGAVAVFSGNSPPWWTRP